MKELTVNEVEMVSGGGLQGALQGLLAGLAAGAAFGAQQAGENGNAGGLLAPVTALVGGSLSFLTLGVVAGVVGLLNGLLAPGP